MNPQSIYRKLSITAICVLMTTCSMAQQFKFAPLKLSEIRSIRQIHNSLPYTFWVADNMWSSGIWNSNVKSKSVHDALKFYVDHNDTIVGHNYTYKLCATIVGYWNPADTSSGTYKETLHDTLTISSKRDSLMAYQDMYISKYSRYHLMKITVDDIFDITGTPQSLKTHPPTYVPPGLNCVVEAEVWQQKYDKLPYLGSYPSSYPTSSYDTTASTLKIQFVDPSTAYPSPALYELEWTYVDNYLLNAPFTTPDTIAAANLRFDFKNNATRIITDTAVYTIPVIYEKGFLVFRARVVRPDSVDFTTPVYTDWSIVPDTGTISSLTSGTHYRRITRSHMSDSLNWQYTVSFAEEGKFKQVLSYFDGSLKNRQTITRFNSQPNKIIATENIYDYKGRPSISILPTPVSQGFRFVDSLSLNSLTGKNYTAHDFDTLQPPVPGACPPVYSLTPLASNAVASKYYSSANTDTNSFQKFVPDAKGYPLVQTQIAAENDKKILKQGGAGDTLQFGTGHITTNYYVEPDQSELNRLFGSEIGRSEYYRKTVTKDPNGQGSYTVLDNEGRTVATGLLGSGPKRNIHAVDSMPLPATVYITENLLDGITQIPVNNTWYMSKSSFAEADGNYTMEYSARLPPFPVCQGAKYLTVPGSYDVKVFDDCGNIIMDKEGSLGIAADCFNSPAPTGTGMASSGPETEMIYEGKYIVQKTMHVSLDSVYAAVDSFIRNPGTCLYDTNYFIRKEVDSTKFPCAKELDYCERIRAKMKAELYPGAKYGAYIQNADGSVDVGHTLTASPQLNSIFDGLDSSTNDFRYRRCDSLVSRWPASTTFEGRTYHNLMNLPVDTLIKIFNDDIAEVLLPLHPEYCRRCPMEGEAYADLLKSIPDYKIAEQLGYFTLDSIISKDPLDQYVDSLDYLNNMPVRLDSIATILALCAGVDTTESRTCLEQLFGTQLSGGGFNIHTAPDLVKKAYFKQLIPLYLGSRSMRYHKLWETDTATHCEDCSYTRMHLVQPSVYAPMDSIHVLDSAGIATTFSDSNGFSVPGWVADALSDDSLSAYSQDSVQTLMNGYLQGLCDSQVYNMARNLINCSLDTNKIKAIRDSLHNFYCLGTGGGYLQPYTPPVIRRILVNCGVALTDLCNPYLVNYKPTPVVFEYPTALNCKPQSYYDDVRDFFNSIKTSFNTLNTVYNSNLTVSKPFQAKLKDVIGATAPLYSIKTRTSYNAAIRQYRVVVSDSANTDSLVFWLKKTEQTGTCKKRLDSLSLWNFQDVVCLTQAFSNIPGSLINQYSFAARIYSVVPGDTVICTMAGYNGEIPFMDTTNSLLDNDGSTNKCLTCPEIRAAYNIFKDSLNAYSVCCVDHPYYPSMLRNYMNYTLQRQYSDQDILDFMASCAVADSTSFQNTAGFFRFKTISYNQTMRVISRLLARYGSVVSYFRFKTPSQAGAMSNNLMIWFDNIPTSKLLDAQKYVADSFTNEIYAAPYGIDTIASVFVPKYWADQLNLFQSGWTSSGMVVASEIDTVLYSYVSDTGMPYVKYVIKNPTSGTPPLYRQLQMADTVLKYLSQSPAQGVYAFTRYNVLINDDYTRPQKKTFLTYNYGLPANLLHTQLIRELSADSLQPLYTPGGETVSYHNPYVLNDHSDLFIDTTSPAAHSGYLRADSIFNTTAAYNAGSINPYHSVIFSSNDVLIYGSGSGQPANLRVYRCGDGRTYWYRKFNAYPSNKLYNLYLKIPDYIPIDSISQWVYSGFTVAEGGDGPVFRFKVRFYKYGSPSVFFYADGYSDFALGNGIKLQKSLLCQSIYDGVDIPDTMNCERELLLLAVDIGKIKFQHYIDSMRNKITNDYLAHLRDSVSEKLLMTTADRKYQFTLYYYDRAGNLIRTVPPAGVIRLDTSLNTTVNTARLNNVIASGSMAHHNKSSYSWYNSLNQVYKQQTPDGGVVNYYYDAVGRVVFSQNDVQRLKGYVSYTLYDGQGRVTETGEERLSCPQQCPGCPPVMLPEVLGSQNLSLQTIYDLILSTKREQVVATLYDQEYKNLDTVEGMSRQEHLRKRIAAVKYFDVLYPLRKGDTANYYDYAAHYSYDIEGNVKTLTHEFVRMPLVKQVFKRVDYDYDVLSGKVQMLSYNRGGGDQFYQRYEYDEDNRITKAETSKDGIYWDLDANYKYYQHGPLARTELGDLRVQGMDYAYTVQGWIKSLNSDVRDTLNDMGDDGMISSIFPRDVFGYGLDYFNGDYKPIAATQVMHIPVIARSLYNGNIARQTTSLQPFDNLAKKYTYDPLNRIDSAGYYNINNSGGTNVLAYTQEFRNNYAYDADGNIKKLVRMGNKLSGTAKLMDSMRYTYPNATTNNKLGNVVDSANGNYYTNDILYVPGVVDTNIRLKYDAIGNLVHDGVSNNDSIGWTLYNKAWVVQNTDSDRLDFAYDGSGNRIMKQQVGYKSVPYFGHGLHFKEQDWYVRDATGNILSVMKYGEYYTPRLSHAWTADYIITHYGTPVVTLAGHFYTDPMFVNSMMSQVLADDELTDELVGSMYATQYYTANPWLNPQLWECSVGPSPGLVPGIPGLARAVAREAAPQLATYMLRSTSTLMSTLMKWRPVWRTGFDSLCHSLNIFSTNPTTARNMVSTYYNTVDSAAVRQLAGAIIGGTYTSTQMLLRDSLVGVLLADSTLYNSADTNQFDEWEQTLRLALQHHYLDPLETTDHRKTDSLYGNLPTAEDALLMLRDVVGDRRLLEMKYNQDPSGFLSAFVTAFGSDGVGKALDAIPNMTLAKVIGTVNPAIFTDPPPPALTDVLTGMMFSLAEHHLYGSSRIGIKYYWPDQCSWRWTENDGYVSPTNSTINLKAPWYSGSMGDFMKRDSTQAKWGNIDNGLWHMYRLLGQKRYELTDHLGDVQATVMDRLTPVMRSDTTKRQDNADVATAVDYYPFGMYMPGRSVSGGATQCADATVTKYVGEWVWVEILPEDHTPKTHQTQIEGFSVYPISGSTGYMDWNEELTYTGTSNVSVQGIEVLVLTESGKDYSISLDIDNGDAGSLTMAARSYTNTGHTLFSTLNSISIPRSAEYTLNFTASKDSTYVLFYGSSLTDKSFTIKHVKKQKLVFTSKTLYTQVCSDPDDYRFGFNNKEKDNEIRGIGNTIDLGGRHLDTRVGRTPTPDPAAREYPGISPYAFVMDNPVNAIDPDGKRVYFVGGAGNDPKSQGWNYINRFNKIWTDLGIEGFTRVNASHGKAGDMMFTDNYRNNSTRPMGFGYTGRANIPVTNDAMLKRAVNGIVADIAKRPLKEGEQLNLAGYSYGSILQEHAAVELVKKGYKIDNLIMIASPTEESSSLMKILKGYQKDGKIGNIIRKDIPGDKLSNPDGEIDYIQGAVENRKDDGHHFDMARPGAEADKKIEQTGKELIQQGVK